MTTYFLIVVTVLTASGLLSSCRPAQTPDVDAELAAVNAEPSKFKVAVLSDGTAFLVGAPKAYEKVGVCSAASKDLFMKDCLAKDAKLTTLEKPIEKTEAKVYTTTIVPKQDLHLLLRELKADGTAGDQRAIIVTSKVTPSTLPSASPAANSAYPKVIQDMLAENNRQRQIDGNRPAQQLDSRLYKAAQDHAYYMARTRNLDHDTNGGMMTRMKRYGYSGGGAENIASGQRSVSQVFMGWVKSPGHNTNMKGRYTLAGFGFANNYWVAVYGNGKPKPLEANPVIQNAPAAKP